MLLACQHWTAFKGSKWSMGLLILWEACQEPVLDLAFVDKGVYFSMSSDDNAMFYASLTFRDV